MICSSLRHTSRSAAAVGRAASRDARSTTSSTRRSRHVRRTGPGRRIVDVHAGRCTRSRATSTRCARSGRRRLRRHCCARTRRGAGHLPGRRSASRRGGSTCDAHAERCRAAAPAASTSGENELGQVPRARRSPRRCSSTRRTTSVGRRSAATQSVRSGARGSSSARLRACLWTQQRSDGTRQYLGAAHGVAGNVTRAAPRSRATELRASARAAARVGGDAGADRAARARPRELAGSRRPSRSRSSSPVVPRRAGRRCCARAGTGAARARRAARRRGAS